MPGITGIFGTSRADDNASVVTRMLQPMLREHFYSSGAFNRDDLGVYAAFVSVDSVRPQELTWNETRTVGTYLAGEPSLDASVMDGLRARGCRASNDVGEALAHLYQERGVAALEKLNGWFSGLIVDVNRRQTMLFNDRYGLSRIYVCERDGRLYFSAEAKSILAVLPAQREIDSRGMAEWFACGCPLGNRTLFRGVSLLPPGSAWIFSASGNLAKQTYFSPAGWESQPILTAAQFSEQLNEIFPRVLQRYTNGNRPIAMSLTGGLDGRMIMAWARPGPGGMPCYTFNGPYRDCADVRIARKVAATCGQPHRTIAVGDEFLAQFPRLAEQTVHISDGAMDVTGASELYVNRLARQIAPVRLTGNYGSEILRRYVAFKPRTYSGPMFAADFSKLLQGAAAAYAEEAACNRLSFIAFKQVPWHHYSRFSVEQSQITLRSPFLDNELVALAFQAPPEAAMSLAPALRLIAKGNPRLGDIPTDRGITYPADRVTNRLHRSVQEFLAKAEYAYDYGMPNWLVKMDRYLSPFQLERLFLGRQKFCHFRTWYRRPLAGYVKDILLDQRSRSRPYVDGAALEKMVHEHTKGQGNFTVEIHKLLSLELLHRALIDRQV